MFFSSPPRSRRPRPAEDLRALPQRVAVRVRSRRDVPARDVLVRFAPQDDGRVEPATVRTGPDGYIYILTDESNGVLARLEPVN